MTQFFVVHASNGGVSLFVVHDNRDDGSGGIAEMQCDLLNDSAGFVAWDDTTANDPDDEYGELGGGTQFTTANEWGNSFTDGFAIGSLDGHWTMDCQFTEVPTGISAWQAVSSDSSTITLELEVGRRVLLYPF